MASLQDDIVFVYMDNVIIQHMTFLKWFEYTTVWKCQFNVSFIYMTHFITFKLNIVNIKIKNLKFTVTLK